MEIVLFVIGAFFAWFVFNLAGLALSLLRAASRAAVGKGRLADNLQMEFRGGPPIEVRIVETTIDPSGVGQKVKSIEVKGVLPVTKAVRAAFVTSVVDKTDGGREPVLCPIEVFQEKHSIAFQNLVEIGTISPGDGVMKWTRVGGVLPDFLIPPRGGHRKFAAIVRLINLDNMPGFDLGHVLPSHLGLLWQSSLDFEWHVKENGYQEAAEQKEKAHSLSIQIGMAVAMADGGLADEEGLVLKDWIMRALSPFSGEQRERLKQAYNLSMQTSFQAATAGELKVGVLTKHLNEVADRATKIETVELCYDVMKADGIFGAEEINIVRSVSRALELDYDEVAKIRDKKFISAKVDLGHGDTVEELLGIDPAEEPTEIRRQLVREFRKWNARLNTVSLGADRDNAQRMIDLIAEARKKYGHS